MYFAPPLQQRIITALGQRLAPGGWLIVSPCETGMVQQPCLENERISNFLFFRKVTAPSGEKAAELTADPSAPPVHQPRAHCQAGSSPPRTTRADTRPQSGGPGPSTTANRGASSALTTPPSSPPQVSALELYRQAQGHYQAKRFELAEEILKRLSNSDQGRATEPTEPGVAGLALSLWAQINGDQGRLQMAEELYQQAICEDRLNPDPYFHLAMIVQELGDSDKAVSTLRKVIYLDPDFTMAHFHLGILAPESRDRRRHLTIACELLAKVDQQAHLPCADQMTAGRILEMARAMLGNCN
jgi:chemotaxis protein methyltransferase CheR